MKLMLAATAVLAMTVTAAPTAGRAADIKLICSNGYHAVIDVIGPQYEKATGNKLVISYGLAAALGKEIEGGEPFDITILAAADRRARQAGQDRRGYPHRAG